MALGPGKYDDMATHVRENTDAAAVVVIVLNGNKGNGFSVQVVNGHALDLRRLCKLLDELSGMIRKDAGTNWH